MERHKDSLVHDAEPAAQVESETEVKDVPKQLVGVERLSLASVYMPVELVLVLPKVRNYLPVGLQDAENGDELVDGVVNVEEPYVEDVVRFVDVVLVEVERAGRTGSHIDDA